MLCRSMFVSASLDRQMVVCIGVEIQKAGKISGAGHSLGRVGHQRWLGIRGSNVSRRMKVKIL
jgi:hypothetical protein